MDKFDTRLLPLGDAIICGCQREETGINTLAIPQVGESSLPEKSVPSRVRLDSLTALRFFAAAMVVVSHGAGMFHFLDKPWIVNLPLAQGVSFFFVLSGFILTYNYPKLSGKSDILQFWRARFARIWPAHGFALFLGLFVFALKPLTAWGVPLTYNILAHIFMVHGWILQDQFFFTINPPSWSISTEFAFYLLFPILIWKQERTWWAKLALAALVVVGFVWYGAAANLADSSNPNGLTVRGLMYINPLVRVFEFVLGMTCATLWRRVREKKISPALLTALEVGCIALIVAYVSNIFNLIEPLKATALGRVVRFWLLYDGNCFAFAGLIFVCALQKGLVSRALSNKVCVWLGEISYSIYLLHMMFLVIYAQNNHFVATVNSPILFVGYCLVLILAAHLTYTFVEKPMRKMLAGKRTKVLTTGDLYRETGLAPAPAPTQITSAAPAFADSSVIDSRAGQAVTAPGAHSSSKSNSSDDHLQKLFAHIPFLDGLRALAIFWVLAFHSGGQFGELISKRGGWAGVDAFFVISGFLITGILLKEQTKTATISLKNFYARRALRLMPAYVLFIAITCLINPLACKHLAPAVGIAAIYMSDYDLALGWGHILGSGMEITWSLAVEEKFYLIWPTVMKFLRKQLAWIGIASIVACFAWRAYLLWQGVFWMRITAFDTKIDALMIGCLGAIALHNPKSREWMQKHCTNFLIPIGLLTFVMFYLRGMGHPFGAVSLTEKILYWDVRLPVFTFSFAALIVSLCLQPRSIVARFFSLPPLVWIGKVSYSLYLWHMLAFIWVMNNAFQPGKSARFDVELLEYGLALTFAAISFYLIERPFLKIKDRFSVMADAMGAKAGKASVAQAQSDAKNGENSQSSQNSKDLQKIC